MGAGVSVGSNIPLMYPLTARVSALVKPPFDQLLAAIRKELPAEAHIEHVLSHLGDLVAIASRNKSGQVVLDGATYDLAALESLHAEVIRLIAETVRYGFCPSNGTDPELSGKIDAPIVSIEPHVAFMDALFSGRANLESRSRVVFATTNYDTLIEDALALCKRGAFDGFSSGGIGFWKGHGADHLDRLPPKTHQVIKLHGSVDWLRADGGLVVRARYGTAYLSKLENTLIYPQATKYVETQKDPFAELFRAFRGLLTSNESHTLCIVGYSFGDEHINLEIEQAMRREGSKTNIIAFAREVTAAAGTQLPAKLQSWLSDTFSSRIYVASDKALYAAGKRLTPTAAGDLAWWRFDGLAKFLRTGVAA